MDVSIGYFSSFGAARPTNITVAGPTPVENPDGRRQRVRARFVDRRLARIPSTARHQDLYQQTRGDLERIFNDSFVKSGRIEGRGYPRSQSRSTTASFLQRPRRARRMTIDDSADLRVGMCSERGCDARSSTTDGVVGLAHDSGDDRAECCWWVS